MLVDLIKARAVEQGILGGKDEITPETVFKLVRDMPYTRASARDPETIIREWRGTCSGKHYLLKRLFAELGYASRLIACTTEAHIDPKEVRGKLRRLLDQSDGRFVDVHNYLILETPKGEMIVDATWPVSTLGMGTVVNQSFVFGENQHIACEPNQIWEIPEGRDPQDFKDEILAANFTPEELAHREAFIQTLGKMTNSRWVKFLLGLEIIFGGKKDSRNV